MSVLGIVLCLVADTGVVTTGLPRAGLSAALLAAAAGRRAMTVVGVIRRYAKYDTFDVVAAARAGRGGRLLAALEPVRAATVLTPP